MTNTPKPQANKTIEDILRHLYVTAVQDADGVRADRKGYHMRYDEVPAQAKQAITQHILDVVERAKPEKLTLNPKTYDRNEYEMRAYNQAIDQFHQNIIKELADE